MKLSLCNMPTDAIAEGPTTAHGKSALVGKPVIIAYTTKKAAAALGLKVNNGVFSIVRIFGVVMSKA